MSGFREKPKLHDHPINAGFFVMDSRVFDRWEGEDLEREVLPSLANAGDLFAYRHEGFWKSMDTQKDAQELTALCAGRTRTLGAIDRHRNRSRPIGRQAMTTGTNITPFEPNPDFWDGRRVAVTGATGFLGNHLTAALAALGARVVVLVRDTVPSSAIRDGWWPKVSIVTGAVEDQSLMERMLGDYDVATVFHLAAQSQVGVANRNPVATYDANVRGTWALLEAARRTSTVRQIVTASSDKAYGEQTVLPYTEDMPLRAVNSYDVSKACSDLIAQSFARIYDLPVVITRCGNFFGPGDTNWERLVPGTIRLLLQGQRPVIRSDGTMTRDYLYVADGVLAYLQLAEAISEDPTLGGEAFNFSTESPLSVLQLVEMLQAATGTELEPDIRATARHEIPHQYLSAAKARKMLGWEPRHTMQEAIAETVDWYRGVLSFGDAATP